MKFRGILFLLLLGLILGGCSSSKNSNGGCDGDNCPIGHKIKNG